MGKREVRGGGGWVLGGGRGGEQGGEFDWEARETSTVNFCAAVYASL